MLPAERFPADGEPLTGEAILVLQGEDDKVTGGSLNGEGSVHASVRAVDAQSALDQIM